MAETIDSFEGIDWGVEKIGAPQVWSKTRGKGVTIVTIDTGATVDHPELQGRVKSTFNMINKNFDVTDEYGHGTHVAGLLVGRNTGVAPEAYLHVIKVLNDRGLGTLTNIMDGITHAINLKADILSISLGVYNIPLILKQRIVQAYEAGVTIVSAVGNSGGHQALYPAFMDEVIAVGGLDKELRQTNFTNSGFDVLAPSVDILSANNDGEYTRMTGTSMASPLVAGGIALLISYYRNQGTELSPRQIKNLIPKRFDLTNIIK